MLAASTLGSISNEQSTAAVTGTSDSLTDLLANKILATGTGRHGKWRKFVGAGLALALLLLLLLLLLPLLLLLLLLLLLPCEKSFDLVGYVLLFFLLGGIARALGAADMLTVDADFVGTEWSLTAMTGAMDPHANWLDDTLDLQVARQFPILRFECQPVLCEQGTGFLLLDGTPMGDDGGSLGDADGRGRGRGRTVAFSQWIKEKKIRCQVC